MKSFFRNNRGATAVEFALVALPVFVFILGIMQTGYIVWADNLLHVAVDAAARCGAVGSNTSPCTNTSDTTTNMKTTAQTVFSPIGGATFNANTSCSAGDIGLTGTYSVTIGFVVNLNIIAKSCYPTV